MSARVPAVPEARARERKPLAIKGADGAPIEIPAGDYYMNTKARARRMMLNSLSAKARRVYSCLELATMGFKTELATKLVDGTRRPLKPADIAKQTEMDPTDVAHGLAELERTGLAERRADDGGALRHGHVRLYSFATPRKAPNTADPSADPGARARVHSPEFRPSWVNERPEDDPLRRFITRWKITFSPDHVVARANIEAADIAARRMIEAENLVRAALEHCGAQSPLIRRKEIERKGGIGSGSDLSKEQSSSSSKGDDDDDRRPTKQPTPPMPEMIWDTARALTQSRSFPKSAVEDYWQLCQTLAGDRGPLDAEGVTRIMQRTAAAAGGAVKTFGYFAKAAPDQVQAFLDHGADEPAMAAGSGGSEWDRMWAELDEE